MEDKRSSSNQPNSDNWLYQVDAVILSIITDNPTNWIRFYEVISVALFILTIPCIFILTTPFFLVSNENFFAHLIISFCLSSLLSGAAGTARFFTIRSSLETAPTKEKLEKIVGYLKLLWIMGLIQFPFIFFLAGLGHIFCGNGCVASVEARDLSANMFLVLWLLLPFYMWKKTKKMIQEKITSPQAKTD